jgi:TatD DNase family protein
MWIDTHCHLDAPEFDPDRDAVVQRARSAGVGLIVVPSVSCATFASTRLAAHAAHGAYALGIHPLFVRDTELELAMAHLDADLAARRADPRLVAVGEIGLDHFVPELQDEASRALQQSFYLRQLALAHAHGLPVILHVRRSADALLAGVRRQASAGKPVCGGIAHAFNGSLQQAQAFIDLGFKLGFGGAMTHERALQIRRLAAELPRDAIVLETDAPDIPPQWLYVKAEDRATGQRSRNEPAELPRIAQTLAELWACPLPEVARITSANAVAALRLPTELWRAL